jgi:hypothetical protein
MESVIGASADADYGVESLTRRGRLCQHNVAADDVRASGETSQAPGSGGQLRDLCSTSRSRAAAGQEPVRSVIKAVRIGCKRRCPQTEAGGGHPGGRPPLTVSACHDVRDSCLVSKDLRSSASSR